MAGDTAPRTTPAEPLAEGDIRAAPAASRRTVLAWTAGLVGPAALAGCVPMSITDADPYDAPGGGRGGGASDSDPSDPVGGGRGTRSGSGSDSDPSDPPGGGRGARSGSGSDSDPSDPAGRGYSAGRGGGSGSDSDPSDPVGRGSGVRSGTNPRVTDADPNDMPGRGRLRTGCTDGDSRPMDPPSAGRRCR